MKKIYFLTFLLFLQYIIVTVLLMLFYKGGNFFNHQALHFILNQNYLSDLGRSIVFNGSDNPSYIYYTITLSLAGIAVALFFYLIANKSFYKTKLFIWVIGLFSGFCYIGIALNPVNESLQWHLIFGRYSFFAFFIASLGAHFTLNKGEFPLSNKLFYFLNVVLFLYLLLTLFGPPSSSGIWVLQLKTSAQKIVVYSLMFCSLGILKEHSDFSKKLLNR